MNDLTIVIITKNEELNIEKCVQSLRSIASRIVIVDSYSTDRTKDICLKLGLDFFEHEFKDHASQLNWAFENTNISTEWTMRMDADEELTEELRNEINIRLGQLPKNVNGIVLKRRVYFMSKWIRHGDVYPQCLLRIFRTGTAICEQKLMDEHILLLRGDTVTFKYDFIDDNTKNLEWWTQKHNWYSDKEVMEYLLDRQQAEKSKQELKPSLFKGQAERKRWLKYLVYYRTPLFTRPVLYFFYRYFLKLGFLDGREGLIFHFLQGFWYRFLIDAKIYEYKKLNKDIKAESNGSNEIYEKHNKVRSL